MSDLFDIEGRITLITGGSNGMGRMIAEGLVKAGSKVYITSRKPEDCERAAKELSRFGTCTAIPASLDTPEAVRKLVGEFVEREDTLHTLINNAGRTYGAPLSSFPDKAWGPVMSVNVQAPFTLVQQLLPQLRRGGERNRPSGVINIGSLAGKAVEKLSAYSYAASKAAIHHLTRELAAELAKDNITVNAVVPGYFPTKMTAHIRAEEGANDQLLARIPLGRLGEQSDIVGMCIFLSSRAGAYITGAELSLDGGLSGCCC